MPTLTNLIVNLTGNAAQLDRTLKNSENRIVAFGKKAGAAIRFAFIGTGVFAFARSLADADNQIQLIRGRLDALGGTDITIDRLRESADRLGISLNDAGNNVARFLVAAKEIGLSSEEVIKLQENIAILGRLGGASANELSSGILQFSQALASGRLQGDELRSILENLPLVAQEIAKGFNVSVGALKDLGKDGELTSEKIAQILLNVDGLNTRFNQLPTTLDAVNARLGNATQELLAASGASALWVAAVEQLATGIGFIADKLEIINRFIGAFGGLLGGASLEEQRGVATGRISKETLKKQDEVREAIDRQTELLKQRLKTEGVNLGFGP